MNPGRQGQQPVGLLRLPGRLFLARLVDRGAPALMIARPSSVQKVLGNDENHQFGLAALECAFYPVQARFYNFVSQSKIIQALPVLGEFLLLTTLKLFRGFLSRRR